MQSIEEIEDGEYIEAERPRHTLLEPEGCGSGWSSVWALVHRAGRRNIPIILPMHNSRRKAVPSIPILITLLWIDIFLHMYTIPGRTTSYRHYGFGIGVGYRHLMCSRTQQTVSGAAVYTTILFCRLSETGFPTVCPQFFFHSLARNYKFDYHFMKLLGSSIRIRQVFNDGWFYNRTRKQS